MSINKVRSVLYTSAKYLGDVNAVVAIYSFIKKNDLHR